LIRAISQLQHQGLPLDLWIAGEGPERERLARQIDTCAEPGSVRLLGQLKDPIPFYQAMDLFALNSIREGLPNVLLEAMAMETPALATRTGGVADLIENGHTGYLIEPADSEQLLDSLRRATANPEAGAAMARRARARIVEDFGFGSRMRKIAAIYRKTLETKGGL
jgi:glycosyltransferase involved in cell wall biosynthesis